MNPISEEDRQSHFDGPKKEEIHFSTNVSLKGTSKELIRSKHNAIKNAKDGQVNNEGI